MVMGIPSPASTLARTSRVRWRNSRDGTSAMAQG